MENWMEFEAMLDGLFRQSGAYPYPAGSYELNWLYEASDAEVRSLPYPRLRDQAFSLDVVFAEYKGRYLQLWDVVRHQGMTPALEEKIVMVCHSLRRMQTQQQRVRRLLNETPPPRHVGWN